MEGITLESLGITEKELQNRVVERIVDRAMAGSWTLAGADGEDDPGESPIMEAVEQRIEARIRAAADAIAEQHVAGKVDEIINGLVLQPTNEWGEPKGQPRTFREFLVERAEKYLTEKVDWDGHDRESSRAGYWKPSGTRLANMIDKHLHHQIETAMKGVLENANSILVTSLQATVKLKLEEIGKALKVEVKTK